MEPIEDNNAKRVLLNTLSLVLVIYSVTCLITAFIMDAPIKTEKFDVPKTGMTLGPYVVPDNNAVYYFEFEQMMKVNNWSYLTIEILDQNKEFLYAFGDEFWNESGYDGGKWHESDTKYETKFTIHKKGTYYFDLITEASNMDDMQKIKMKLSQVRGSSLGFYWLSIISLGLAILLNEINRQTIIRMLASG